MKQILLAATCLKLACPIVRAQGTTAFTYQGQLRDNGTNANGAYTMIFKLYDAVRSGNQIGSTLTTSPTLANGLFTVNLDFGAGAFNGFARWLDITVTNAGVTQTLSPRVQVLPTPYAQYATSAAQVSATVQTTVGSNTVVSSDTWNVGAVLGLSHALAFSDNGIAQMVLYTNGQGASFPSNVYAGGTFYGNGSGLTNLPSMVPRISVFLTNGTFVIPTNVTRIMVELWGAGGGGGNAYYDSVNGSADGGGGGAGGYAWNVFSVNPGASYSITTGVSGAGQDGTSTSFGNLLSATGGSAGGNGNGAGGGAGGAGGTASGGLVSMTSASGYPGYAYDGDGGSAWRGGPGGHGGNYGHANGYDDAVGPGGGGGGGFHYPAIGAGGNGFGGMVIVYY